MLMELQTRSIITLSLMIFFFIYKLQNYLINTNMVGLKVIWLCGARDAG